tara:strand:- start:91 stop:360 length:270 start_codon:yes stop_codon:yes gene_type:complete
MNKQYDIAVWGIHFCKVDENGNELRNKDGTVKKFTLRNRYMGSPLSEKLEDACLEIINREYDSMVMEWNDDYVPEHRKRQKLDEDLIPL